MSMAWWIRPRKAASPFLGGSGRVFLWSHRKIRFGSSAPERELPPPPPPPIRDRQARASTAAEDETETGDGCRTLPRCVMERVRRECVAMNGALAHVVRLDRQLGDGLMTPDQHQKMVDEALEELGDCRLTEMQDSLEGLMDAIEAREDIDR